MVTCWKAQLQWKSPYLRWINPLPPGSKLSVEGNRVTASVGRSSLHDKLGNRQKDGFGYVWRSLLRSNGQCSSWSTCCFRGSWVATATHRNPSPLPQEQGSWWWHRKKNHSSTALLASLWALGQRTKGIPPELGQLAILVLVQTVWNAHHSPELTGTVTNEAKMAGMTFPC